MNGAVKVGMQVAFLLILIWVLAALTGMAPGASVQAPGVGVRIGKRKRKHCHRRKTFTHVADGMVGELITSQGSSNVPLVGVPRIQF